MADIFNEIEEEIRHDRAKVVWQKYGKYVIGLAIVIVLVTVGQTGWKEYTNSVRIDRSDRFAAAMTAAKENNLTAAAGLFSELGEDGGAGYGALARLQSAALQVETGDKEGAMLAYEGLSNDTDIDPLYRDLATILSVMHQMDTGDASQLLEKLGPQLAEDAPWRFTARELAAALSVSLGELEKAKEYLAAITDDLAAPQGARARATERLKAMGG